MSERWRPRPLPLPILRHSRPAPRPRASEVSRRIWKPALATERAEPKRGSVLRPTRLQVQTQGLARNDGCWEVGIVFVRADDSAEGKVEGMFLSRLHACMHKEVGYWVFGEEPFPHSRFPLAWGTSVQWPFSRETQRFLPAPSTLATFPGCGARGTVILTGIWV